MAQPDTIADLLRQLSKKNRNDAVQAKLGFYHNLIEYQHQKDRFVSDLAEAAEKQSRAESRRAMGVVYHGICNVCHRCCTMTHPDICDNCLANPPKPSEPIDWFYVFSLAWVADWLDDILDNIEDDL